MTFKALNAACQHVCKASAHEGAAGVCGRKSGVKNDKRGAGHMFIKTSASRVTHAGASSRTRADVMTSRGLVENRKKKTDDNIISVGVTFSLSAPRKAV